MITDWDKTLKEMGWDPHAKADNIPGAAHSTNQPAARKKTPLPVLMVAGPIAGLAYLVVIPMIALFGVPYMIVRKAFWKERNEQACPTRM